VTARRWLAAAAAMTMVSPAAAEDMPPAGRVDMAALRDFGACMVERYRDDAVQAVEGDFRDEEHADAQRRFAERHARCLGASGGELRTSGVLFAGAMAEALLREDLTQEQLRDSLRPVDPPLEARSDTEYVGLCMALKHPAETAALVYSDPAKAEGDTQVTAYAQNLPQCVQQGQQLRINKPGLRAIATLAAYRIAAARRAGEES